MHHILWSNSYKSFCYILLQAERTASVGNHRMILTSGLSPSYSESSAIKINLKFKKKIRREELEKAHEGQMLLPHHQQPEMLQICDS